MSDSSKVILSNNTIVRNADIEPNDFGKHNDFNNNKTFRGCCLLNDDLLPDLLRANMRANLFPEEQKKILNTIRNGLVRVTSRHILDIERANTSCKDIRLLKVDDITSEYISLPRYEPNQTFIAKYYTKFFENLYGHKMIGCELWTVNRCGTQQTYKINYFKADGDSFYSKIAASDIYSLKNKIVYSVKSIFQQ